jgi:hypothetical protein
MLRRELCFALRDRGLLADLLGPIKLAIELFQPLVGIMSDISIGDLPSRRLITRHIPQSGDFSDITFPQPVEVIHYMAHQFVLHRASTDSTG